LPFSAPYQRPAGPSKGSRFSTYRLVQILGATSDFHQDIERLRALDFSKQEDQITFNYLIQEHLGVFTFLLQDGKLYEFYEIVEMGDKGMEQITGGGKGVILVDHQFIEDLPLSPLDSLKIR